MVNNRPFVPPIGQRLMVSCDEYVAHLKGPDRGAVIVMHSMIAEELRLAITKTLEGESNSECSRAKAVRSLMRTDGPLWSFSSQLHLARCLGLIDNELYDNLVIINDIRNAFAHRTYLRGEGHKQTRLERVSFGHQAIKRQCNKLTLFKIMASNLRRNAKMNRKPTKLAYSLRNARGQFLGSATIAWGHLRYVAASKITLSTNIG